MEVEILSSLRKQVLTSVHFDVKIHIFDGFWQFYYLSTKQM